MIHRWLTNCVKVLWRDKDPPLPTIPVDHHVTPTCYFILLAGVATPLLTDSTFLRCLSATAFPSDDHHGQTKIGRDLNFPRNLFFLCCSSMESVSNPTARHDCRLRRGGGRAWDRLIIRWSSADHVQVKYCVEHDLDFLAQIGQGIRMLSSNSGVSTESLSTKQKTRSYSGAWSNHIRDCWCCLQNGRQVVK